MSHQSSAAITRRGFLVVTGSAVAVAGVPTLGSAQTTTGSPAIPGKDRLIVRSPRPVNLETGLADLTTYHTPEELFFVRNNYDAPVIDPTQWSLKVEGEIERPLVLRLDDLLKLPAVTQDVTLECAGNGRSFHKPRASGIQWEYGALGNARWKGVRLADVLAMARPKPAAAHVAFDGFDKPPTPQAPDFIRSVPLWKAGEPHTMLAFEMNGKPIPHLHGGPIRVVVPGFVGSASVKWLDRIAVLPAEFDGPFMNRSYRAPRAENEADTYSLQSLEVKSLIVSPADGAGLQASRLTVWGWAWAGEGELAGIDLSTDGGQSWKPGRFTGRWDRYSWRRWEYDWDAVAGTHTLMARASDSLGRIQPATRARNPLGYRWNAIHAVKVNVA